MLYIPQIPAFCEVFVNREYRKYLVCTLWVTDIMAFQLLIEGFVHGFDYMGPLVLHYNP